MVEELDELCKTLNTKNDTELIKQCADCLSRMGSYECAKLAYMRLNDIKGITELIIKFNQWKEGVFFVKQNNQFNEIFYKSYGDFLMLNERYDQAQEAYKRANRGDLALKILDSLTENAIIERRFKDAAYFYWKQAIQMLTEIKDSSTEEGKDLLTKYEDFNRLSHIYYAYDLIDNYIEEPFQDTTYGQTQQNILLNASCYILNIIGALRPYNISLSYIYFVLGKMCIKIGAYWTTQKAFETLRNMKVPKEWEIDLNINCMKIRSGPLSDKEGLNPICPRCMNTNKLLTFNNDKCTFCSHPFIRSFISFDILSLVEFNLPMNLSHEKAIELIKTIDPSKRRSTIIR